MKQRLSSVFVVVVLMSTLTMTVLAQGAQTKEYLADRIRKVEDGVDEFRDWAKKRGEDATSRANSNNPQARHGQTKDSRGDLEAKRRNIPLVI